MRHGGKSAADLYEVQSYYQRFNQKNNMTRQPFWNPAAAELAQQQNENLSKRIKSNRAGYELIDWGFYVGSMANMVNSGFSVNWPNRSGNSWLPLARRPRPDPFVPAYQSYGKLKADPATATRLIRKMAQQFGADEVGFCLLDRKWVYSHWFDEETKQDYPIKFSDEPGYETYQEPTQLQDRIQVIPKEMKYVIVLIYEMDERGMATAPTLTQMATTLTTYSRMSFTTVMLAEFIRGLGFNAIPSANDTALSIPLAVDAGLGELGRNAKLITPRFGPRCRISKVITDLPLALGHTRMWGVTEFCNVCMKCAKECPVGAIPLGERSFEPVNVFNHRGVLTWQLDHMKCYEYWAKTGTNCGICIRTCPFNKAQHWVHNLARWSVKRRNSSIDSLMVWMDDMLGYGKFKNTDYFWGT
ncbi:reductive dehalogenase [Chloroflexota bacterium]